jgi:hypothetical protein
MCYMAAYFDTPFVRKRRGEKNAEFGLFLQRIFTSKVVASTISKKALPCRLI